MKYILIPIFLSLAASACSPRQNNALTEQEIEARKAAAPMVAEDQYGNKVSRVCIGGVAYLLYRQTIIRETQANGNPVECKLTQVGA